MALPGRSGRRGGAGFRWIAAGVVITLLVLLIDASINSRSPGPGQSLAAGTWVDRILPVITASNSEGQVLASVWTGGLKIPSSAVAGEIDSVATGAAQNYSTVAALRPPAALGAPAGLLDAVLLARNRAAQELQKAFTETLGAAAVAPGARSTSAAVAVDPTSAVPKITAAWTQIQFGDQAYQMFLSALPATLGVRLPPSAWGGQPAPYTAPAAQVFLASLQSAAVTSPVYRVKVLALSTNPPPVSTGGGLETIPDAGAITLDVVVADTGNQPASNLTVTASISPAGHGSSTVRDFVDLAVGQSYTIQAMGPLNPPQGVPVTLTVTVAPPSGSQVPPVTRSLMFEMPAPPPPTTTTTPTTTTPTTRVSSTPPTT